MSDSFWNRPEIVERFAGRSPDHRLQRLLEGLDLDDPGVFAVLDVGCAGGRNTVFLAEAGVDVHAVDAAEAMVSRTRERVAEILGGLEAARRVRRGVMSDLDAFDDRRFDLVVALGVIQSSRSMEEWDRTLSEIARVTRPGGRVLVSNFARSSEPEGHPLQPVEDARCVFLWRDGRPMVLMDAEGHDASFEAHGFFPVEETETVHVPREEGYRVTINAFYERMRDASV